MGTVHRAKDGSVYQVDFTFETMVNKKDPATLDIAKGESPAIINMLPTSTGSAFTRDGYTRINTDEILGGWSNGEYGYYFTLNSLYYFDGVTPQFITSIVSSINYSFVEVNNLVVFTNNFEYLVLDKENIAESDSLTFDEFETSPPAGSCAEFYNGRLYIAKENILYCLLPFTVDKMDIRYNVVAAYDSDIVLVHRVDNGLYVSTEKEVFFLLGKDPFDASGFTNKTLSSYPAIRGTGIKTNGDAFPVSEYQGSLVVFASTNGVVVCANDGNYKNLSFDKISYTYGESGTALYYEKNGEIFYLLSMPVDYNEKNKYEIPSFNVGQEEI